MDELLDNMLASAEKTTDVLADIVAILKNVNAHLNLVEHALAEHLTQAQADDGTETYETPA